jgi:hypothetical protein
MAAVTIPNAGKYDLLIDTGFLVNAFTLDDSTRGRLDDADFVLDGSSNFASVAEGTLNVNLKRGRQDENDAITNGTMSFTLNDTLADGVFNPFDDDPSNPYFDQLQGVPGLAPGRAVKLIRYDDNDNPELLFVGFVVNYDYTFTLGGLDTVTVFCVDNMYRLAQTFITGQSPTKEFTGTRINWVLDLAEVDYPTGAARNIHAGTVELGGGGAYSIADGQNVKAYFDQITYSAERGRIFVDREGVLVSQNRIGQVFGPPELNFKDDGTGAAYRDIGIAFRAEDIINLVQVTPAGGSTQTASDANSQATYFIKSLYIINSLLHDNSAADDLANYLLSPEPEPRFDNVETWYGNLTSSQRDAASILDLGSYISIEKEILIGGSPNPFAQDLTIEGLEHRIDFARGHTARFYTSPAQIVYQLILDHATYGVLDSNNVLG